MRILGIDFGTKRIGIAVSDELHMLARELAVYSPTQFWHELPKLLTELELESIVLGFPLGMSGQKTKKTEEVENFKVALERVVSVPVILMDERLSSVMAEQVPTGHDRTDSLAAQIVLQNYLNREAGKKK